MTMGEGLWKGEWTLCACEYHKKIVDDGFLSSLLRNSLEFVTNSCGIVD